MSCRRRRKALSKIVFIQQETETRLLGWFLFLSRFSIHCPRNWRSLFKSNLTLQSHLCSNPHQFVKAADKYCPISLFQQCHVVNIDAFDWVNTVTCFWWNGVPTDHTPCALIMFESWNWRNAEWMWAILPPNGPRHWSKYRPLEKIKAGIRLQRFISVPVFFCAPNNKILCMLIVLGKILGNRIKWQKL